MGNTIVLIGFMGSGKTTTGKLLTEKYGYRFLDMDEMIIKETGKTIARIFEESGESGFRDIETALLRNLCEDPDLKKADTVISTGGGVVIREENRALLKKVGTVFYLEVTPEDVLKRLEGNTDRPLLKGNDREEKVNTLMSTRKSMYEEAADIIIRTSSMTPEETAGEIIRRL